MKLGIDCDGVIFDFVDSFRSYIKTIGNPYKAKLSVTPKSWNMWEWWEIEKQEFWELLSRYSKDRGFSKGSPMDLEVVGKLKALSEKHEILITTARHVGLDSHKNVIIDSTVEWLDFFNIPYHDLLFLRDKTLVKADIFLDDGAHHLEALHKCSKIAVCYDQPYNQSWVGHRVKNWTEFEKFVEAYE